MIDPGSRPSEPIAAPATPFGTGALAVIRTSGSGTIAMVDGLFDPAGRLQQAPGNTVHHGYLRHPHNRERLDEVMATVYRAPRSYTGEDSVEISCHGSIAGIERILSALFAAGFRRAEPGEFTLRAFLAGKIDLTRAEAVQEIVGAQTRESHAMALQRLGGAVEARVNEIKARLVVLLAAIDIQLDYPEEETGEIVVPQQDIAEVEAAIRSLLATYRTGRMYQQGVRIAIAGRTNAGKSSLFNVLLRQDRSIVSEIAGTTRDYIESPLSFAGVPARLFDTAGFRQAEAAVESEGIRRSTEILHSADLVVYVVDACVGLAVDEVEVVQRLRQEGRLVGVWNKVDRTEGGVPTAEADGFVALSAVSGQGVEQLIDAITHAILPSSLVWNGEPVIDSLRQKELLERALDALGHAREGLAEQVPVDTVALDMEEAVRSLGEITGEITSADILDAMFSGFCVGK